MQKKIHQVWIQGAEHFASKQPEFYAASLKWPVLFPDFEYKLWSEVDFLPLLNQFHPNFQEVYEKAPNFSAKADIARHAILFFEGGLYVDTDYEAFKNFEYLLADADIVVVGMHFTKSKELFGNFKFGTAWIYSIPEQPLFAHMLTKMVENPFDPHKITSYDYCWGVTGPYAFGTAIKELNLLSNPRVRVLPHPLIELADFSNVAITKKTAEEIIIEFPYAVGIHRCDGSWTNNIRTIKQIFGEFYTWVNNWSDFVHIGLLILLLLIPLSCVGIWKVRQRNMICTPKV